MATNKNGLFLGILLTLGVGAAFLRFWELPDLLYTLWIDEAWFSLQGVKVASGENFLPLRVPGAGVGDSAFQIYGSALMQLFGVAAPYSSRFATAAAGTLLVWILYPFWCSLWSDILPPRQRDWAALIAVLVIGTTFTAILHSRQGLQMSGAALMTVLSIWTIWQTERTKKYKWGMLAGLSIAVSLTTYEAALALPLILAGFALVRLIFLAREGRGAWLKLMGAVLLFGLLFYAPMILFYWQNPGVFLGHVFQTQEIVPSDEPQTTAELLTGALGQLVEGTGRVLWGISVRGDSELGRNLPGRPLFDPFVSLWVWLGLAALVPRWRSPTVQLLAVWGALMILPSALSDNPPAFSRMLPLLPLLAGLAGYGTVKVVMWLHERYRPLLPWVVPLLAVGFLAGAGLSINDYFGRWVTDPRLFDRYYAGARISAETALALAEPGASEVFVTNQTAIFSRYPYRLLLDGTPVRTFDVGPACFPFPHQNQADVWFGVVHNDDKITPGRLEEMYGEWPDKQRKTIVHPQYGDDFATFFKIPAGAVIQDPEQPLGVDFGERIRLLGYDLLDAGEDTLKFHLYWEWLNPLSKDYNFFIHVQTPGGDDRILAQYDGAICPGFRTSVWEPGLRMVQEFELTLPARDAAARTNLWLGVYDFVTGERLPDSSTKAGILRDEGNSRIRLMEFPRGD